MAPAVSSVSAVCLNEYANLYSVSAAQRLGGADNNSPGMDRLVGFCLHFLLLHHLFWNRQASLQRNYIFHLQLLVKSTIVHLRLCYYYFYCFCFLPQSWETANKKQPKNKNRSDSSELLKAVSMQLHPSLVCLTGVSSLSQYRRECNPVHAEITSPPLWQMAFALLLALARAITVNSQVAKWFNSTLLTPRLS